MDEQLGVLLYEEVRACFERGDSAAAARVLQSIPPTDVADLFRSLEQEERIELVRHMPAEQAASVLSEIDDRSLTDLFELLQDGEIVELLDTLPSDDAADLVGYMDEEDQDRVIEMLDQVDHQDAVELKELLRYPEDSAGGLMAKEFLSVREDKPVSSVIVALRQVPEDELSTFHYCFVIDHDGKLVGQIGLIRLLLSDGTRRARDIMETEPIVAHLNDDQEQVANLFLWHDLLSLPIVDDAGRLVGRVTVDDAMDVITEEASEDVARLAGSSAEEFGETSPWRISRARLPWLVVGLVGEMVAATVLSGFENNLRDHVALAFFIPMVMATGGNTGIQSSSIMIRALVTHDFDKVRAYRHLGREVVVGLMNGLILGVLMFGVLTVWRGDGRLGLIIGLSLMCVVLMATVVGTFVPWMCDRVKIDPTVATGPFITTSNDVVGLAVYLGIAHWLLSVL